MEEKKLLRQLKRGDTAALEEMIDQYSDYAAAIVRSVIGKSMSTEDVEEVVADVFFTLWKQREQIRPGSLRGYLGRIARNQAVNKLRERGETIQLEEDILLPEEDGPEQLCSEREQRQAVQSALLAMGQPDREIFLRHYYYCQSVADIGGAMGMNHSTVKSRLARGRQKLKLILEERGYSL